MLGWLGLEFTRSRYVGHEGQVDINSAAARQIIAKLADRFKEGHCFNITDRTTDFTKNEIIILIAFDNEVLDLISDVRNYLNRRTEIIAPAFLFDNVAINPPCRDVVLLIGGTPRETLIMTKIKVSFGAIVGYKHFAMLIGRHRSGVDVEIQDQASRIRTRYPRAWRSAAKAAAAMPFPREETTPPVMKTYRAMGLSR